MKIQICFLGTGAVVPTAKRNHPSIFLKYKDENILIDCGEGTQRQFRKANLNLCSLTRILITHFHGDHVLGLPGLLQTLTLNNYNKILHIYIPAGTSKFMEKMLEIFVLRGKLRYEIHEIERGIAFENKDFKVLAEKMSHDIPTLAYSFIEKDKIRIDKKKLKKLKIKGKIIGELSRGKDIIWKDKKILASSLTYNQTGKKITFIADTRINENIQKIAENSDLLICESTYTEKEKDIANEYGHLMANQSASIAKKAKVKSLILFHLSQRYENSENIVLKEAKKIFAKTKIAQDLEKIEV